MSGARNYDALSDAARRRWTYTGPGQFTVPVFSASPTSPDFAPLTASASHNSRMSGLTDNTLSSPASSALNTPEMTRWTTLPASPTESNHLRASFGAGDETQYSPNAFTGKSGAHAPRYEAGVPLAKQSSSPLMRDRYGSPSLDAPLLNIIPGLPPLKFPLPVFSSRHGRYDSLPAPPSPLSESCSPPASFTIPSPREEYSPSFSPSAAPSPSSIATDFFPIEEATPQPSPQLTIPSLPSSTYVSDADSLILPPSESADAHVRPTFVHASTSASQMDAFALAAAVAASPSQSSLSLPTSFQSQFASGTSAASFNTPLASPARVVRPYAPRQPSCTTQASTGHRAGTTRSVGFAELVADDDSDTPGIRSRDRMDETRWRRRSAPPPIVRRSPRPLVSKTISSRVDVGSSRRLRSAKEPVLGKMRKIGERIRGLFKNKDASPVKARSSGLDPIQPALAYGLMTTTTAVTNVEYESEHPIPAPSPRAKMMRNHRRSLPLPSLLLPSSAENIASAIFKRPSAHRAGSSWLPQESSEDAEELSSRDERSSYTPTHSPRTPRPRRQRNVTADQIEETQATAQPGLKARRFSLSSALPKSRLDSLRLTMLPRPSPPLPSMPSHSFHDNVPLSSSSQLADRTPSADEFGSGYWGEELPSVQITRGSPDLYSVDASPRRMRTQTAPSAPQIFPEEVDTVNTTPKAKRPRRFSLSSMMARRASRSRIGGRTSMLPSAHIPPIPTRAVPDQPIRRARGDTITTITQGVPFDMVQPRHALGDHVDPSTDGVPGSYSRFSVSSTISSSHTGSAYFDAREQLSEDNHHSSSDADRSCSPGLESDLDSMSFARTPEYCSGTFSFRSSGDRPRYLDTDELSIPGSYHFKPSLVGKCASTSAVSHLFSERTSAPVKTLRFSPSLSLSFDRSWSDDGEGDDNEIGMMDREEDRGFMRALGFEFDEIARRVREEPI
ncbi:uncharacterized protein TRAVEDRAFT_68472 [Trametes versicolor FP-101664 SS1]|uniref:uncharacterized protein n=1 Tax=Trametes versicolor (strain FP-101664) TaxID=717944 RepID=UPI0004622E6F|nr:uncharacterized protein TRAVEDRAFT_68472 [Trametes versicolor FP-101664 SS1]EIW64720.1 hypothetical protein TRAVEDRAFT_68472 [Trametes versicolor FP-101664 SS1]